MPELPEVEQVKISLLSALQNRRILAIDIRQLSSIHRPYREGDSFKEGLVGRRFIDIQRRGKYLIFLLDGVWLVCHLRMTGKLIYQKQKTLADRHTHVIFDLDDQGQLIFHDVRRFGGLSLWKENPYLASPLIDLGPEPLSNAFSAAYLQPILQKRQTAIKNILLNQTIVAGIGNIYADEALFAAGLRPRKAANRLRPNEIERLVQSIRFILRQAIAAGGSSIRDYRDGSNRAGSFQQSHHVYGRGGKDCHFCGHTLKKIKVGGRTSVYCPQCQQS